MRKKNKQNQKLVEERTKTNKMETKKATGKKMKLRPGSLKRLLLMFSHKSCPTLVTPWTTALQAPVSMEFPRQKSGNTLQLPSPSKR